MGVFALVKWKGMLCFRMARRSSCTTVSLNAQTGILHMSVLILYVDHYSHCNVMVQLLEYLTFVSEMKITHVVLVKVSDAQQLLCHTYTGR